VERKDGWDGKQTIGKNLTFCEKKFQKVSTNFSGLRRGVGDEGIWKPLIIFYEEEERRRG
jgi:hypothetical protein